MPADNTTKLISGNVAAGMIHINGADRVTIDGRSGGAGRFLTFRNTNPAGATIRLSNDASGNTVRSSVIEGASNTVGSGVILFSTGTVTGNDDNTVTDNQIRDRSDALGVPFNLILSAGTAGAAANSNNTVSDNELFNFLNCGVNVSGVVADSRDSWTVAGNNAYQTAARAGSLFGISVGASGSNTISGNTIHDLTASGPIVRGINLVPTGTGTTNVSGNRIYALSNTSDGTETTGVVVSAQNTSTVNVFDNMVSLVPSGAQDQQGEGTIQNDDPAVFFSIDDVSLAEGNAGTTNFVFTVTKTGAGAASVDFATQDVTAADDSDYASNSGTLNFASGDTAKTITVLVNGDTTPEAFETFRVLLSNASGASISDDTGTGTIGNDEESVSAGQLIISEFRLRGPGPSAPEAAPSSPGTSAPCGSSSKPSTSVAGGARKKPRAYVLKSAPLDPDTSPEANDEFIELYNATDSPLLVTTTDGSEGWAVAASDGLVRFIIPVGTVIPPHAHFLSPNLLGYSLTGYSAGDGNTQPPFALGDFVIRGDGTTCFGYELDIPDNAGIALFRTSNTANFSLSTRLDAAGSTAEPDTLYREGVGYPALAPVDIAANLEHSFYRSLCTFVAGVGCTTPGVPKDSGDNAADFLFVNTEGTLTAAGQRLGAPGPENLASNVQSNGQFSLQPLDRSQTAAAPPNRVRSFTPDLPNNSTFGTLSVRRRVTNNTGADATALRFRIVELTSVPAPTGTADLRARDSADIVVTGVNDSETCAGTTPCDVDVRGTMLEQSPSQPNGGGYNSSLGVSTITLSTPLAPGESVNVQFLLGIQQTGTFRFLLNIEAVTAGPTTAPAAPPR